MPSELTNAAFGLQNIAQMALRSQPFKLIELTSYVDDYKYSSETTGKRLRSDIRDGFKSKYNRVFDMPFAFFESDAIISESYNKNASVTTYPVEKGNPISEHAMTSDFTITITGVTSDASMSYFDTVASVKGSFFGQLLGATSKSQKAWTRLNKWMDEGTPLRVQMKFARNGFLDKNGSIIPFVIESLNVPRDKDTGNSIRYVMTLRQIKLVTIGTPRLIGPLGVGGINDKGAQGLDSTSRGDEADSQTSEVRESLVNGGTLKAKMFSSFPRRAD